MSSEYIINIKNDKEDSLLDNHSNTDSYEYSSTSKRDSLHDKNDKDTDSYNESINEDGSDLEKALLQPFIKKEQQPKKSKRIYWADCARIFSMLAIVFLHSAGHACEQHLRAKNNDSWVIVCIYNCITRFGVPMFVLLSGTFILDPSKKFSFKKLFCHNIFRLATAFIFWSTINALLHIYLFQDRKPSEFLELFIVGEEYLWFIYMIIGCYIISPFLRLFSDDIVLARYFLGLCVIWGSLLPTINNLFHVFNMKSVQDALNQWIGRWHYHFTLEFVGYFVAGYHLVKHVTIRSVMARIILYIVGLIDVYVICHFTVYAEKNNKGYSKDFRDTYTFPIALYAVILFIFFKHEIGRIEFSSTAIAIINKLSGLTFGVYLSHMIIKSIFSKYLHIASDKFLGVPINPIIGCPINFTIITITSFIAAYLLSITPILKKYVL